MHAMVRVGEPHAFPAVDNKVTWMVVHGSRNTQARDLGTAVRHVLDDAASAFLGGVNGPVASNGQAVGAARVFAQVAGHASRGIEAFDEHRFWQAEQHGSSVPGDATHVAGKWPRN